MRNNIPAELKALPQWVCSGITKVPVNPRTGRVANIQDPSTWATFEEACNAGFPYIGMVLTENDPYTIIDLDDKVDRPASPEQLARHAKIMEVFDSYAERSSSGRGFHIIVKGKIPTGVHRDAVEVYSSARYMICTGDVVNPSPIQDYQGILDVLYAEMRPADKVDLDDYFEGATSDADIIERGTNASNGEKFLKLCNGEWQGDYESQSEADFALLAMLAFYTADNEQVRRLFRFSPLGKREKAVKNDTYLNHALAKVRAQQPRPVDFTALAELAKQVTAPPAPPAVITAPTPSTSVSKASSPAVQGISPPPGLIGEIAQYFYSAAIRPVPEIALMAAIALVAGVVGRSYNISGSGLNQYLIVLARTGSGKEGALSGMENLLAAVRPNIPMVDEFMGPAAFASGQALVKTLNERPCFVSVLGEFGLTLQQLSDSRANSAQLMLRKVLLDLYAKSGWNRSLRSSVYSDSDKNTKTIQAPNVTILGESTPETFFDGLDASHIAEGLVPRFSVMEYNGDRPRRNRQANRPPEQGLIQRFVELVTISLTTNNNNTCAPIQVDDHSLALLDDFDSYADDTMNASKDEVEVQLWNRAHLKALKMAGLLAVGINPHQPIVTMECAEWAIHFVKKDIGLVTARFAEGDVGKGDSKQLIDLKRAIASYFQASFDTVAKYAVPKAIHDASLVPYLYLIKKTAAMASFRHDRLGSTNALKKTLGAMVEAGVLVEVPKQQVFEKFGFSGSVYGIGNGWN